MSSVVINGREHQATEGQTISELLHQAGITRRRVIVEHNGEPLQATELDSVTVKDGDRLEVVQLVGGG